MTDKSHLPDSLSKLLEGQDGPYLSICLQRPDVAGNSQKWDIYSKNILQQIKDLKISDDIAEDPKWIERTETALDAIDPDASSCGGWLLILSSEQIDIYELSDKPESVISFSDTPYLLPKLTDNTQNIKAWVLAVDQDHPGFYRYDGQGLENRVEALSFRSYADMQETRQPMSAVNYHSNGPAPVGGNQGAAKFHALGVATDDYDEVQLRDFMDELANAVEPVISGTGRPLILAGDPKRVGWMKEAIDLHELCDEHIDQAGDALTPERLLPEVKSILKRYQEKLTSERDLGDGAPETVSGFDAISEAAQKGKIDTLFLLKERDGHQESETDERLQLNPLGNDSMSIHSNKLAIQTLSLGGQVEIPLEDQIDTKAESFATLRY